MLVVGDAEVGLGFQSKRLHQNLVIRTGCAVLGQVKSQADAILVYHLADVCLKAARDAFQFVSRRSRSPLAIYSFDVFVCLDHPRLQQPSTPVASRSSPERIVVLAKRTLSLSGVMPG